MVAGAAGADEAVSALFEGVEEGESLAREDGESTQGTLLQIVVRGESFAKNALVVVQELFAAVGGATGASAEFVELVEHFPL